MHPVRQPGRPGHRPTRHRVAALLGGGVLLLLAAAGQTQVFADPFAYPAGPLGAPWRVERGVWEATGSMAQAGPSTLRQYAVVSRLALQDCVVECVVRFNPTAATFAQRGGVVIRARDAMQGHDLLVLEAINLQPLLAGGFDAFMISEYGNPSSSGGGVAWIMESRFLQARLRLTAIDARVKAEIDVEDDGRYDRMFETQSRTVPVQPGALGLHGSSGVQIGDFRLFDGVLIESLTAPPARPGAVVPLRLRGFPAAFYQAAASFGVSGLPAGPGRIPLSPDALFAASLRGDLGHLLRRFAGRLDASGDGTIEVAIPPLPALAGTTIRVAFVAHREGRILNISNDLALTVTS